MSPVQCASQCGLIPNPMEVLSSERMHVMLRVQVVGGILALLRNSCQMLQLTFVARVVRLVENSTNFDIKVEDGTGQWDVKLYVDAEEETAVSLPPFQDCQKPRTKTVCSANSSDGNHL